MFIAGTENTSTRLLLVTIQFTQDCSLIHQSPATQATFTSWMVSCCFHHYTFAQFNTRRQSAVRSTTSNADVYLSFLKIDFYKGHPKGQGICSTEQSCKVMVTLSCINVNEMAHKLKCFKLSTLLIQDSASRIQCYNNGNHDSFRFLLFILKQQLPFSSFQCSPVQFSIKYSYFADLKIFLYLQGWSKEYCYSKAPV